VLTLEGLRSHYGRIEVIHGVSLAVNEGEIVTLVGSNGAGKTTLLRAISGVQPTSGGSIRFAGETMDALPAHQRVMRGIVQVPEGRQVFAPLSVEDNLRLGAFRRTDDEVETDLAQIYATFPLLTEKRRAAAGSLSGGQQQMLAIGRALMARPKLILLDEPSMGLAPVLVEQIFAIICDLKARGLTTLLVEQNANAALAIADRGYVMETGRIVMSGLGKELLDNPRVQSAYLGI
jgi:branched-chain amino acid transport system ATP-binding protein